MPPQPNRWHESAVTTAADLSSFTEVDLAETRERVSRLSRTLRLRVGALDPLEWDRPRTPDWTVREIVEHVATAWYAEQVVDPSAADR